MVWITPTWFHYKFTNHKTSYPTLDELNYKVNSIAALTELNAYLTKRRYVRMVTRLWALICSFNCMRIICWPFPPFLLETWCSFTVFSCPRMLTWRAFAWPKIMAVWNFFPLSFSWFHAPLIETFLSNLDLNFVFIGPHSLDQVGTKHGSPQSTR